MRRTRPRRGFSQSDFVALAIILPLILLLVIYFVTHPYSFGRSHVYSRRLRCSQQMRDIGAALNQYEIDKRSYPGYRNVLLTTTSASFSNPANGENGGVSWVVPMLPYLDYQAVYDAIRKESNSGGDSTATVSANFAWVSIENLFCPSDPPALYGGTPLSYIVNAGCIDAPGAPTTAGSAGIPRDWPANGVFFDRFTGNPMAGGEHEARQLPQVVQTSDWISKRDGLSQTIMLLENIDAGQWANVTEPYVGAVWDIDALVSKPKGWKSGDLPPQATPTTASLQVNHSKGAGKSVYMGLPDPPEAGNPAYQFARPSSMHTGGANIVYCDGTPGFLSETIEYFVFCLLMSPDGNNVKRPGVDAPLKDNHFGTPLDSSWQTSH